MTPLNSANTICVRMSRGAAISHDQELKRPFLREQFATHAMAELGMCKYVFVTSGGRAVGGHRELERDG